MRFYDVTSWSYVNLDDPVSPHSSAGKIPDLSVFVAQPGGRWPP